MLLLRDLLLGEVVETVTGVLSKNYYKEPKMKYLDEFEKDILQTVEANEWKSKNNKDTRLKELQSYIKMSQNNSLIYKKK